MHSPSELPRPPGDSRQSCALWLLPTFVFLLLGFAALPVDQSLAGWIAANNLPGGVVDVLERAETFAHGIGVVFILLTIFIIDRSRRWTFPRLILAVAGSGLAANLIKLILIARTRPHAADLGDHFSETFGNWLPLLSESAQQSTPSSHTATGVAFAIALCWLFPRGRWIFAVLAILASCQRMTSGSHYLSDVLWGAALGYFLGRGIISGFLTEKYFNRLEERLRPAEPHPSDVARSTDPAEVSSAP